MRNIYEIMEQNKKKMNIQLMHLMSHKIKKVYDMFDYFNFFCDLKIIDLFIFLHSSVKKELTNVIKYTPSKFHVHFTLIDFPHINTRRC